MALGLFDGTASHPSRLPRSDRWRKLRRPDRRIRNRTYGVVERGSREVSLQSIIVSVLGKAGGARYN